MADRERLADQVGKVRSAKGRPEASALLRPEIGAQAQFRKKKKPAAYRYDSSLSPSLDWDELNHARERAEEKIAALQGGIERLAAMVEVGELSGSGLAAAREDAGALKALSKPFLNWTGKAERLSFDVPTLPLFVHERLSTAAILETLKGHSRDRQTNLLDLFGESRLPIHGRLLKAYEHRDGWVNRLILGDSLIVMNSLIRGPRRSGADDGSALRREIRLELPALRAQARRDARRGRRYGPRAGDGSGIPRHLGTWRPFVPDLPARPAAAGPRSAASVGQHLRADVGHQPAPRPRGDGRGVRRACGLGSGGH